MLLRLLPLTALLLLLGGTWAASQEVPDCWCMHRSDGVNDSIGIDTCGINPKKYNCFDFALNVAISSNFDDSRLYAKGPWELKFVDSTIQFSILPHDPSTETPINYNEIPNDTIRKIFRDIEIKFGSFSLIKSRGVKPAILLQFVRYVNVSEAYAFFKTIEQLKFVNLNNGIYFLSDIEYVKNHRHNQILDWVYFLVGEDLILQLNQQNHQIIKIKIVNSFGQIVFSKKINIYIGMTNYTINIGHLPAGVYIIAVDNTYQRFHTTR